MDKLLKQPGGVYESGAFKLSAGRLQPTALAGLIRELCLGLEPKHPLMQHRGWWHCDHRFIYPAKELTSDVLNSATVAPLLIIGANGTLGKAFIRACKERNIYAKAFTRYQLDITDQNQIAAVLDEYNPWGVINASGYVRVDDAETDFSNCYVINTQGVINLAEACSKSGIKLVNISSDLVFNGKKKDSYNESDVTDPQNLYGYSKVCAEEALKNIYPASLIIRTSAFFGPHDKHNFAYSAVNTLLRGDTFSAANDLYVSPTYVPDLVNHTLNMLIDGESGVRHVCNEGLITWSDFATMVCENAGLNTELINAVPASELCFVARRPVNSSMKSEYGTDMPSLGNAINRFIKECELLRYPQMH